MRFSCARCGKRYATNDVPLPGRIYRLKCKACGNVIVVKGGEAPASPAADRAPVEQKPSSSEPSAVTPLADLAPPGANESSEESKSPGPAAASAAPGEPRYIELFEAGEFETSPPPSTSPSPSPPPPTPTPAPVAQAQVSEAVPTPPPLPAATSLTEELRESVEDSLDHGLIDDPFARARVESLARSADESRDQAAASPLEPLPVAGSLQPAAELAPDREAADIADHASPPPRQVPEPPRHRPVGSGTSASSKGRMIVGGVLGALVLLGGIGVAVWATKPATHGKQPRTAQAPASGATAPAPAPAAGGPSPSPGTDQAAAAVHPSPPAEADHPSAPAPAPPSPEPAQSEPERTVAAKPAPDAPAPIKAPPRAQPKVAEKQPSRPAKPAERKVAKAEPSPAPAAAPAAPAATAPADTPPPAEGPEQAEGLPPEAIRRALAGGRKAFDACLRDPSRGLDQPLTARQVTLRFTVDPEGNVGYPTIDDVTISGAPVGQCLKAAARGLNFPTFRGDPVKVDAPISIPGK